MSYWCAGRRNIGSALLYDFSACMIRLLLDWMAVAYWRKDGEPDRKSLWSRAGKTCKIGQRLWSRRASNGFPGKTRNFRNGGMVPCMVAGVKLPASVEFRRFRVLPHRRELLLPHIARGPPACIEISGCADLLARPSSCPAARLRHGRTSRRGADSARAGFAPTHMSARRHGGSREGWILSFTNMEEWVGKCWSSKSP